MSGQFKDATGYPINMEDTVMYHHGGRYAGFVQGTVKGFTPKMVRVQTGVCRDGSPHIRTVFPDALCVYTGRPER